MGALFSKPKMPSTVMESTVDAAALREAANAEAERRRKAKGFANSIFTGPSGDTSTPTTFKTKLGE